MSMTTEEPTTRSGLTPRRAVRVPRPATDRQLGRPMGESTLTKDHLRILAQLEADKAKITDLKAMIVKAEAERDRHVRRAVDKGIAKAVIGRTLGVSATTITKAYGAER